MSAYDNYDDYSISTENIKSIRDRRYLHPNINKEYAILRIYDHIRQAQNDWKRAELSEKSVGKGLNKIFKVIVKELNN